MSYKIFHRVFIRLFDVKVGVNAKTATATTKASVIQYLSV